ncbi:MAG TPA: DUF255 domain-containing protein [Gemmatimonadales bacterium]|nr:DUF255 domain-containing protein [Gemmatimonadales bacterium]
MLTRMNPRLLRLLLLCAVSSAVACTREHGALANRMARAGTPYLTDAAREPVSWQPWGMNAFHTAARLDRPILLYIGGDDCRGCALMDRETYGDPVLGALIDSLFVPVRVDRDERPDVAERYQTAVQLLTGLRGYPLTVFLMPDGSAFFGGTYFPADDPITGRGMRQILPDVARSYKAERTFILHQATLVRQLAYTHDAGARGVLEPNTIEHDVSGVRADLVTAQRDRFVLASFRYMQATGLLLAAFVHDGDTTDLQVARAVLDWVADSGESAARSGERDGPPGVLRAAMLRNLASGWSLTGDAHYRVAAGNLVSSLERDLADTAKRVVFADREAYVIGSMLEAAASISDSLASRDGVRALDALLARSYTAGHGVRHTSAWPPPGGTAPLLLQDQIQTASACLAAYNTTGIARYLTLAVDLMSTIDHAFADPLGGYYDASVVEPAAPAFADRTKQVSDDLLPGANAAVARVLLQLGDATGDASYRRRAEATLEAFAGVASQEGMQVSNYLTVALAVIPAR